jgi:hypothetical protein
VFFKQIKQTLQLADFLGMRVSVEQLYLPGLELKNYGTA